MHRVKYSKERIWRNILAQALGEASYNSKELDHNAVFSTRMDIGYADMLHLVQQTDSAARIYQEGEPSVDAGLYPAISNYHSRA
jgi:hypothetical protein